MTSSTGWLARVVQVALDPSAPPRLDTVVGVIGEATGASSAVLWEEARDETGSIVPSVLAQWNDGLSQPPGPRAADPCDDQSAAPPRGNARQPGGPRNRPPYGRLQ